jgi:MotA/TolQ/ExbB proton channel family
VWEAYWETARTSTLDGVILLLGVLLIVAHLIGLGMRFQGKRVLFVQELDRYRTVCLLLTELLPVLGLLGTVLSLMHTFKTFQLTSGEAPDLSQMIQTFAPALSTTISGLMMIGPNLVLNAILWLACPSVEHRQE